MKNMENGLPKYLFNVNAIFICTIHSGIYLRILMNEKELSLSTKYVHNRHFRKDEKTRKEN
jgi:hypothetical protein